jgi:hypothetical protein
MQWPASDKTVHDEFCCCVRVCMVCTSVGWDSTDRKRFWGRLLMFIRQSLTVDCPVIEAICRGEVLPKFSLLSDNRYCLVTWSVRVDFHMANCMECADVLHIYVLGSIFQIFSDETLPSSRQSLMRSSQSDTTSIHSRLQWTIVLDHTIGFRSYQCYLLCSSSKKF